MGLAGRLPARLEDLHGPERGVIVLPRHLAWPGMREFDVADDRLRRSLYGIVLTQGRRNDLARFVNPRLLTQDWPLLRSSLDPKLRRWCERRLALRALPAPPGPARAGPAGRRAGITAGARRRGCTDRRAVARIGPRDRFTAGRRVPHAPADCPARKRRRSRWAPGRDRPVCLPPG